MNGSGDDKARVLAATDLAQLVGQSVKLVRRGAKFVGLCPFHQEKSPSFQVDPGKQLFYCFGCKAGGTAFEFIMKRDRVEFREALEILARDAGIQLSRSADAKQKSGLRQQLLDACAAAVSVFDHSLRHSAGGKAAREYLASRGFAPDTLKKFGVGFAADSWDHLLNALSRKFGADLLLQAGLIKRRDGGDGMYDAFRNRVMFPIRDETGRTIAFGGRVMPNSDAPAKYLNSAETPLFSKSRAIFGLDHAKQKIVETRTVAVVEGYTDVVMAHQCGATNVVSILGTAMTEQHISILRRFADRIVLMFDADTAGASAVNRTVELFLTQPIEIAVATIPEDLDPDEFILKHGLAKFNDLLSSAVDALTYKWKSLEQEYRADSGLTARQTAITAYLDLLAGVHAGGAIDGIRFGAALNNVAKLTGLPLDNLHRRFKPNRAPVAAARRRDRRRPAAGNGYARCACDRRTQRSGGVRAARARRVAAGPVALVDAAGTRRARRFSAGRPSRTRRRLLGSVSTRRRTGAGGISCRISDRISETNRYGIDT